MRIGVNNCIYDNAILFYDIFRKFTKRSSQQYPNITQPFSKHHLNTIQTSSRHHPIILPTLPKHHLYNTQTLSKHELIKTSPKQYPNTTTISFEHRQNITGGTLPLHHQITNTSSKHHCNITNILPTPFCFVRVYTYCSFFSLLMFSIAVSDMRVLSRREAPSLLLDIELLICFPNSSKSAQRLSMACARCQLRR